MTDGTNLNSITGISEYVSWELCRLNHYVIKSSSEFFTKKLARGRAAGDNGGLNKYFFNNHDKNEVRDNFPYHFLSKIKYYKTQLEFSIGISPSLELTLPLYKHGDFAGRSYVDHLSQNQNILKFQGWASYPNGDQIDHVIIVINKNIVIRPTSFAKKERPDVVSCGISNYPMCGFHATYDLSSFICHHIKSIDFYAVNKWGDALFELNTDNKSNVLRDIFPQIPTN